VSPFVLDALYLALASLDASLNDAARAVGVALVAEDA
jgi:hypothetical protein